MKFLFKLILALGIFLIPSVASAQVAGTPTTTTFFYRNLAGTTQTICGTGGVGGCTLEGVVVNNFQASITAYIQLFNTTSAGVTLGTTEVTFEVQCLAIPTPCVFWIPSPYGAFSINGWSIASTTTEKGSTGSATGVLVTAIYL